MSFLIRHPATRVIWGFSTGLNIVIFNRSWSLHNKKKCSCGRSICSCERPIQVDLIERGLFVGIPTVVVIPVAPAIPIYIFTNYLIRQYKS